MVPRLSFHRTTLSLRGALTPSNKYIRSFFKSRMLWTLPNSDPPLPTDHYEARNTQTKPTTTLPTSASPSTTSDAPSPIKSTSSPTPNPPPKPQQLSPLPPAQSPSRRPSPMLSLVPPSPAVSCSSRPVLPPRVEKTHWLPLWRSMLWRARRWEKPAWRKTNRSSRGSWPGGAPR